MPWGLTRVTQACTQLAQDAQWAVRSLRRRLMFAASVALMLGMGIGLNAAIFTVVDAALFKGFRHVQRNDRLVRVGTSKARSAARCGSIRQSCSGTSKRSMGSVGGSQCLAWGLTRPALPVLRQRAALAC